MDSDFEDDLADVMEDSDTEFVVEDGQNDDNKDEDQEADTSISDTTPLSITTLTFKIKKSMSPGMLWTVLLKAKMIP